MTLVAGGSITFEWSGNVAHDLSIPALGVEENAKTSFSKTILFANSGNYTIRCVIHPTMTGTVTVVD